MKTILSEWNSWVLVFVLRTDNNLYEEMFAKQDLLTGLAFRLAANFPWSGKKSDQRKWKIDLIFLFEIWKFVWLRTNEEINLHRQLIVKSDFNLLHVFLYFAVTCCRSVLGESEYVRFRWVPWFSSSPTINPQWKLLESSFRCGKSSFKHVYGRQRSDCRPTLTRWEIPLCIEWK